MFGRSVIASSDCFSDESYHERIMFKRHVQMILSKFQSKYAPIPKGPTSPPMEISTI